ncbi:MAG: sigma-70 family RNA polymerase sigma factor [Clostridiales bacterium]|nr:sigma-70 family RNA polymerase sigma factor [Clostridiales bacterium]MBR3056644.1 sigma-70 family RNA polymerase sigma factor [Clostridiales bacterium]
MNDDAIIRLYWNRDESAITETSRKYGNYCFSIAYNILYNNEDSEECVNDTYSRVWNTIPPQKPSVFSAFIGRIVRNISLDRYRKNLAEKRGGNVIPALLDEIGEIASDNPSPEDDVVRNDLAKAINDFLYDLPLEKRVMIVRRYWYADDIKSIALRLGTSENNISTSIRRIRIKLRDYLLARGFEL